MASKKGDITERDQVAWQSLSLIIVSNLLQCQDIEKMDV